jgi:hypothetical protein
MQQTSSNTIYRRDSGEEIINPSSKSMTMLSPKNHSQVIQTMVEENISTNTTINILPTFIEPISARCQNYIKIPMNFCALPPKSVHTHPHRSTKHLNVHYVHPA